MNQKKRSTRSSVSSVLVDTFIINGTYMLSLNPVLRNQQWIIYSGLQISNKKEVTAFLREINNESRRSIDIKGQKTTVPKQKQNSIYVPSFCCKQLYRGPTTLKGKQLQAIIFAKIGVSIYQVLQSFDKVTSDLLYLMIMLFVKFIKKVHLNSLSLTSLSFKNLFIGWQTSQRPQIFICNTSCLKLNLQSQDIGFNFGNSQQINKIMKQSSKENQRRTSRSSMMVKPSSFISSPPRKRSSRISINKGKIGKRSDVQILLTKLRQIQNDYKVIFDAAQDKKCFDQIIQFLAKQSLEYTNRHPDKYDIWIASIKKIIIKSGCEIDLKRANQVLFEKVRSLKSGKQKNMFMHFYQQKQNCNLQKLTSQRQDKCLSVDDNYDSEMSEKMSNLQENLKSHILKAFEQKSLLYS